jgi:hypothetical protein
MVLYSTRRMSSSSSVSSSSRPRRAHATASHHNLREHHKPLNFVKRLGSRNNFGRVVSSVNMIRRAWARRSRRRARRVIGGVGGGLVGRTICTARSRRAAVYRRVFKEFLIL